MKDSLLLGVGAALAGAGEAGIGIMQAGQRAALGKFLAFSRVQESSADAAGAEYLSKAGISGRGSLTFFGKLRSQEFRYGRGQDDEDGFVRTHPLSRYRLPASSGPSAVIILSLGPLNPRTLGPFVFLC
mgnify:CR=1 FL=1